MKNLIIITGFIILITGCSKQLEVNPLQSVDESFVFKTDANIKAALNGAYDVLSGGYLLGGDMQLYSELLGANDEITWAGTYQQPREIYQKAILTNNSYVRDTYLQGYRAINICNNIITNIENVNDADRDAVKGQALFIRGLIYFELAELYALPYSAGNVATNMGLQIVTTPTVNGEVTDMNKVPRSSVKETYDQVIADLIAAKPLIQGEVGVLGSEFSVSAVLSRVYLQMANYAGARDEANLVIANSGASLESNYAGAFNNMAPSSEDIFVLPVTAQDGTNDLWLFFSIKAYGARSGDVRIKQKHIDLYNLGDERLALFYVGNGFYRSGKWQLQYRYLPIIRLAEMYLTRAESNFRLGTSVGATPAQDLNKITQRAGLSPVPATLANILYQRRLELADEGQRIQDAKRLMQSTDGFAFDANELVFPIPLREVNAGAGVLKQNPGY
ncbi:MAG: RagB/SusD family nutrient uptake outer membrane protein [Ginsengibacter sp.]